MSGLWCDVAERNSMSDNTPEASRGSFDDLCQHLREIADDECVHDDGDVAAIRSAADEVKGLREQVAINEERYEAWRRRWDEMRQIAAENKAEIKRLRDGIRDIVRDDYCCYDCFDAGSKAPFSETATRLLELIGEPR